jgi:hypothetical protein
MKKKPEEISLFGNRKKVTLKVSANRKFLKEEFPIYGKCVEISKESIKECLDHDFSLWKLSELINLEDERMKIKG